MIHTGELLSKWLVLTLAALGLGAVTFAIGDIHGTKHALATSAATCMPASDSSADHYLSCSGFLE